MSELDPEVVLLIGATIGTVFGLFLSRHSAKAQINEAKANLNNALGNLASVQTSCAKLETERKLAISDAQKSKTEAEEARKASVQSALDRDAAMTHARVWESKAKDLESSAYQEAESKIKGSLYEILKHYGNKEYCGFTEVDFSLTEKEQGKRIANIKAKKDIRLICKALNLSAPWLDEFGE